MDDHKTCTKCQQLKPLEAFYRNGLTGRTKPACIACVVEYQNRYNAAKRGDVVRDVPRVVRSVTLMNGRRVARAGEVCIETRREHRDDAIAALAAASAWWMSATDIEERDLARDATVFRAKQLIEAEGRCEG